jgi:hypothetical protein
VIGKRLGERLCQQFITDNKTGTGSNIGTEIVLTPCLTATLRYLSAPPTGPALFSARSHCAGRLWSLGDCNDALQWQGPSVIYWHVRIHEKGWPYGLQKMAVIRRDMCCDGHAYDRSPWVASRSSRRRSPADRGRLQQQQN